MSAKTGHGIDDLQDVLARHRAWLEDSGELARRRARHCEEWTAELFERRYGSLGIERLGGRDALREAVASLSGTALDRFSLLATRAGLDA